MHTLMIQLKLKALGFYTGVINGQPTADFTKALLAYLKAEKVATKGYETKTAWLQVATEQSIIKASGIDIAIDGKVSEALESARAVYARQLGAGAV